MPVLKNIFDGAVALEHYNTKQILNLLNPQQNV